MALFGNIIKKFRGSARPSLPVAPPAELIGFVLLNQLSINENRMAFEIKMEFGEEVEITAIGDQIVTLALHFANADFNCTVMPLPMVDEELNRAAAANELTDESRKLLFSHKSFVLIAIDQYVEGNGWDAEQQFGRICKAVMELDEAVGLYSRATGLLIDKQNYQWKSGPALCS